MTKLQNALLALLILPSISATEIRFDRKFEIIANDGSNGVAEVVRHETECVRNRQRSEYTQEQWDARPRSACYYLEIRNATIRYNDTGEEVAGMNFMTNTILFERMAVLVSDQLPQEDCVQGIESAIRRTANGGGPYTYPNSDRAYERFSIPQFSASGVDAEGNIVIDTAQGNIAGIMNQTFSYKKMVRTNGGDIPNGTVGMEQNDQGQTINTCNPSMFSQADRVRIVDEVYTRVEDPDAPAIDHVANGARNVGRGLVHGWETVTTGIGGLLRRGQNQ